MRILSIYAKETAFSVHLRAIKSKQPFWRTLVFTQSRFFGFGCDLKNPRFLTFTAKKSYRSIWIYLAINFKERKVLLDITHTLYGTILAMVPLYWMLFPPTNTLYHDIYIYIAQSVRIPNLNFPVKCESVFCIDFLSAYF